MDSHDRADVGEDILCDRPDLEVGAAHGGDQLDDIVLQQPIDFLKRAVFLSADVLLDLLNVSLNEPEPGLS